MKNFQGSFERMNFLSANKIPFFFMIDFLAQNIIIIEEKDLEKADIFIKFPDFKFEKSIQDSEKNIFWENFPQSREDYQKGFEIVQKNLKGGNSYLANYTCQTEIKTNLSLKEIYKISDAKYKVYFDDQFVFFSPETFVEIKENKIFTYPMKGTIDASVENAVNVLKEDKKELAEHYTVVDLLRNDLSMVAYDVHVERYRYVERLNTHRGPLLQTSSEIRGRLTPHLMQRPGDVIFSQLPAGSITGAPKKKTVEIIAEAENYHRDFYTGVMGRWDNGELDSAVMIRFIDQCHGKLFFKAGGGITAKSNWKDEYHEVIEKVYAPICRNH